MKMKEKMARLRLIRSERVGPVTFGKLIHRYGSGIKAVEALPELARRSNVDAKLASLASVNEEYEKVKEFGGDILVRGEEGYPEMLDQFDDAPGAIGIKGHPVLFREKAIALVGSRNASANAITIAEKIARELGEAGIIVVSGMARGIDAAAHTGGLPAGTIAVLAGGVDQAYPRDNLKLYKKIAQYGLLMAEMPFGVKPLARHFPMRNRLIAALSVAVVVVEAGLRSGSLISAREAADRGREVMALPGSPADPRAQGCNNLIRQGAILVQSAYDITEALKYPALAMACPKPPISLTPQMAMASAIPLTPEDWAPPPVSETPVSDALALETAPEGVSTDETDVAQARIELKKILNYDAVNIDELIRQCDAHPAIIHAALLEMELAGEVMRHFGNRVSRIYIDSP